MSDRVLVTYASETGSTQSVAEAIAKYLAESGLDVDVRSVGDVTDLSGYTAAVVGSAIHGGAWLPAGMQFLRAHREQLNRMRTALFLVCLTQASPKESYRQGVPAWMAEARELVAPVAEGFFAGELWYKRYRGIGGKVGMRIFSAAIACPEGDYRDWDAIRAWTDHIGPLLRRP